MQQSKHQQSVVARAAYYRVKECAEEAADKAAKALAMAREIPPTPAYLQAEGAKLWERAWAYAITWLSPDSDMQAVEAACRLADANVAAQNKFMATLEAADARAFTAVNKAFRESLAALGFDPTSRSRLGVAEVQKASALDELIARREKRN